jgi:[ribosomal protein S5]-alanine N-acetyltransferase
MNITESSRLVLRVWTLQDIDAGLRIWGDERVMQYIGGQILDRDGVRKCLLAGAKHQQRYACQHWAVIEKNSQQIIGCCGFSKTESEQEAELVFHFVYDRWGRAYATEAGQACLDYARKHLLARTIIASTELENKASQRVLEKLGFCFVENRFFEDSKKFEAFYELKLFSKPEQGLKPTA